MSIQEMYDKKSYEELLDYYIKNKATEPIFRNTKDFAKKFNDLCIVNATFAILKCYKNFLQTCKRLFSLLPITDKYYKDNLAFYLENILTSLIYFLFNPKDCDWIKFDIKDKINEVIDFIDKHNINTAKIEEDKKIYYDSLKGKKPQYVVEILYPHQTLFQDHKFDLKGKDGYQYIDVSTLPREGTEPLTKFTIARNGYTVSDPLWTGPDWSKRMSKYQVFDISKIINMLILLAGNCLAHRSVSILALEQVGTIQINQMDSEGNVIGRSDATDFSAFAKRSNVQDVKYLDEELNNLNNALVNMIGCQDFPIMYQRAKNNMLDGLYVESFLTLSTVLESMFYYWTKKIANKHNIGNEYNEYIESEFGGCKECNLFIEHESENIIKKGMKPNLFQCIDFLRNKGAFNKSETKKIKELVGKAKNDSLRNDVVHGKTYTVPYDVLKTVDDAIIELQEILYKNAI